MGGTKQMTPLTLQESIIVMLMNYSHRHYDTLESASFDGEYNNKLLELADVELRREYKRILNRFVMEYQDRGTG